MIITSVLIIMNLLFDCVRMLLSSKPLSSLMKLTFTYLAKHNSRIWNDENPRKIQERPLHSLRVTVWCGINASTVIGQCIFSIMMAQQ